MSRVSRAIFLGIGIALGIGALVFVTINRHPVEVDLYFFEPVRLPLWLLVLACLLIGWAVPQLLGVGYWYRRQRDRARLNRRIRDLEREVLELRNIPLDAKASPSKNKRGSPFGTPASPRAIEAGPSKRPRLLTDQSAGPNSESEELDIEVQSDR